MDLTPRLGLQKPTDAENVSIDILDSNYDIIDSGVGFFNCTSATRPGSPFDGQCIYETDTKLTYVYQTTLSDWVLLFEPMATGMLMGFSGAVAPTGWSLADGTEISRSVEGARLFGLVGTAYGAGNGSTTFNKPNFKGRALVGLDSSQTEFNALGKTGGEKNHTLSLTEIPAHSHGLSDPGHSHRQYVTALSNGSALRNDYNADANGGIYDQGINTGPSTTGISMSNAGGSGAHNNLQPYQVANVIVKL